MIRTETSKLINDEKGGFFVFGPWWFVIIVMAIAFIASAMKNNNVKNSPNKNYDYDPNNIVNPIISNNICPKCGQNNTESAKFCNKCGNNLFEDKFCSKCGSTNLSNAKFCQECGNELNN